MRMEEVTIDMIRNSNGEFSIKPSISQNIWERVILPLNRIAKTGQSKLQKGSMITGLASKAFSLATVASLAVPSVIDSYNDFMYDEAGNERGSMNFAFNAAHDNAQGDDLRFYDASMNAIRHGVHPIFPLLIAAKETRQFDIPFMENADHDAQGPYQMQALYFIERVREHAQETHFYQNLSITDPRRITNDMFVDDNSLNNPTYLRQRATELRDGTFGENSAENIFLSLRHDFGFTTELLSLNLSENRPETLLANMPQDYDAAMEHIAEVISEVYSEHMMGVTGSRYMFLIAEHYPDLIVSNSDSVQAAADELQDRFNILYDFDAISWVNGANQNRGIFRDGADTRLGDLPDHYATFGREQTDAVFDTLDTAQRISGQTFMNFLITGENLVETYFTPRGERAPEISIRPTERPFNLGGFRPQMRPNQVTVEISEDVTGPSPQHRPIMRPDRG